MPVLLSSSESCFGVFNYNRRLNLSPVMKEKRGTTCNTGPSNDAVARASAASFREIPTCPGTHTNRTSDTLHGTRHENILSSCDCFADDKCMQTDKASVIIITFDI